MTPFVLHAKPAEEKDNLSLGKDSLAEAHVDANVARYCDILKSIEELIEVNDRYYLLLMDVILLSYILYFHTLQFILMTTM